METSKLIQSLRFCGDKESCCSQCPNGDRLMKFSATECVCDLMQKAADTIEVLQTELRNEMHRHDRLQDFEVAEDQQSAELRAAHRWIPVTERLPEDGQDVLGFLQNDTESRIFPANYDHNIWFDCLFNIRIQSVSHWMPLPEPPKD